MTTVRTQISDAELTRLAGNSGISEVRDTRHPIAIRFRSGGKASVFVVRYRGGKTIRTKIANWPDCKVKDILKDLPQRLHDIEREGQVSAEHWTTAGDVLKWYRERAAKDRSLTADRRANIDSSIKTHLLPRLEHLELRSITRQMLDEVFIWPLQNTMAVATVRFHFAVLKRCFRMASILRKIQLDPLGGIRFSEFISKPLRPKPSALRPGHLPDVLEMIHTASDGVKAFLILFMLMYGTRIGETRQLRWSFIDWEDARLTIPGTLTKNKQEHRLPLTSYALIALKKHQSVCTSKTFLFQGKHGPMGRTSASRAVKELSGGGFSAHDLRKLARSCWADLGVDYMVAEQLLNHTPSRLDKTYIHTYLEQQKREALELWHSRIFAQQADTIPTQNESVIASGTDNTGAT